MNGTDQILWTESMPLFPQHFQQQDRSIRHAIQQRFAILNPFRWGFLELQIDQQLATVARISLSKGRGIFRDGTLFDVSSLESRELAIPIDTRDCTVFLAIAENDGLASEKSPAARYLRQEKSVKDFTAGADAEEILDLARLNLQLLLEGQNLQGFSVLPFAFIKEVGLEGQIIFDDSFIPPWLDIQTQPALRSYLTSVQGLMEQRADSVSSRLSEDDNNASHGIYDVLFLQSLQRHKLLLQHLRSGIATHPEEFYRMLLNIVGEFEGLSLGAKKASPFRPYNHLDLAGSFDDLTRALREQLEHLRERKVEEFRLTEQTFGLHTSVINDRSLFEKAQFVLEVSADIPLPQLASSLPDQIKIGPLEQIKNLVRSQLPGIGLQKLATAPRQIPFHSKSLYLDLDRNSEFWRRMPTSSGIAIHVSGQYPGLNLTLWTIKETEKTRHEY